MAAKSSAEPVEIHVTEVFGVTVLRKYVDKTGNLRADQDRKRGLRTLMQTIAICMLLSTLICVSIMVVIMYHPPPLVKDLSESLLLNFGKGESFAQQAEQLKYANDQILVFKGYIENLKEQGLANFTREEMLIQNLSAITKENTELVQKLSEANKAIESSKEVEIEKQQRVDEIERDLGTCMNEKSNFKRSLLKAEQQLNKAKENVNKCDVDTKQLNSKINSLEHEKSSLQEELKKADEVALELEKSLTRFESILTSVRAQKESAEKNLKTTNNVLADAKKKNEEYVKINAVLAANLTTSEQKVAESNKQFEKSQFKLGECKNKNMDHEVRGVELLTDLENCKKELKTCN